MEPTIKESVRVGLIERIFEIGKRVNQAQETLFLAVGYMDRVIAVLNTDPS